MTKLHGTNVSNRRSGCSGKAGRRWYRVVAVVLTLMLLSVTGLVTAQQQGGKQPPADTDDGGAGNGENTPPADPQDNGAGSDAPPPDPEDAGVHQVAVVALVEALPGFFRGTGCSDGGGLCPREEILRWEVAVWFVRALDGIEPRPTASRFTDVSDDVWWAGHVDRLKELGVTVGCRTGPPRFCPHNSVIRAEMATFLVRAFDLPAGSSAGFVDTAGHGHARDIDSLAFSGVTAGCSTQPRRYCPDRGVTRGQMATFLARALGLVQSP